GRTSSVISDLDSLTRRPGSLSFVELIALQPFACEILTAYPTQNPQARLPLGAGPSADRHRSSRFEVGMPFSGEAIEGQGSATRPRDIARLALGVIPSEARDLSSTEASPRTHQCSAVALGT